MIFNKLEWSHSLTANWLYDRFLQLLIYPSIWVAAALASLGFYTQNILDLGDSWQPIALIFVTALIPYNLDRIFDSYVQKIPDNKAQLFFRQPCIWVLLLTAISLTIILLYNAPLRVRYISIAGIIPLLYGVPLFPGKSEGLTPPRPTYAERYPLGRASGETPDGADSSKGGACMPRKSTIQWYRLKDIPGSKAWIVGTVLTYAVITLPIAYSDAQFNFATGLITLFMFVFIVTNSHIFDIRDIQSDKEKGVITLPTIAGVKGTKIILSAMNLLVLLFITLAVKNQIISFYPEMILALTINLIYIWKININTPRWVYNILIEGFLFIPLLGHWAIKIII
ncbi:UbiA prenyltransferase family protein [Hyella patelloides LEGE 07179]|uniref:UbiA prenyltransferase family protein n=1 Tax=Hyella patelloides LEGE 07179 TaxID=945734 RepID=A0A563W3V3_9CYAN|nr:UbiA family prenyltransferase [Hyella patelloides]VEP18327.1 UbiA prenyltransferase family protein [Hyella patelloides LEGE 07179]